jgi:hypothetical protein
MELLFLDGTILDATVQFTGDALNLGDLDFDGDVDVTDWRRSDPACSRQIERDLRPC